VIATPKEFESLLEALRAAPDKVRQIRAMPENDGDAEREFVALVAMARELGTIADAILLVENPLLPEAHSEWWYCQPSPATRLKAAANSLAEVISEYGNCGPDDIAAGIEVLDTAFVCFISEYGPEAHHHAHMSVGTYAQGLLSAAPEAEK